MMNSRLAAASRLTPIAASSTGRSTRSREMPAARRAVISWCRWIQVTVNITAMSVSTPLMRSNNVMARKA